MNIIENNFTEKMNPINEEVGLNIDNEIIEPEIIPTDGDDIVLKDKLKEQPIYKKKITKTTEIYTPAIMNKSFVIPFEKYDKNINNTLLQFVKKQLEGKCLKEGYVKPDSIELIEYSPGSIIGDKLKFQISLQCLVCYPVEGMIIDCTVKNVTKAGIRAEISKYEKSPMVIFVARDHHYDSERFSKIAENDIIQVKIIGMRFELNDSYVSVIAELI